MHSYSQVRILLLNTKFYFILFSGQLWSTKKWHAIFILHMKMESDAVFCSSPGSWAPAGQPEYEAMVWGTAGVGTTYPWDAGMWTDWSQLLCRYKMLTGGPGSASSWWEKGAEAHSVAGGEGCWASAESGGWASGRVSLRCSCQRLQENKGGLVDSLKGPEWVRW